MKSLFLWKMWVSMTKQLWMLLSSSCGLLRLCTADSLTTRCVLKATFPILFINYYTMNASQSRRREDSSIKKLQNSKEIDTLYHEFESLKSQIYGVKREARPKPIDAQWSSKNNKEKAVGMLRESTIHKCQQELQENLTLLQSHPPKTRKNLFKPNASESDDFVADLKEAQGQAHSKNFSKKLREYSQEASLNLEEPPSLKAQALHFAEGEQIFRQFLSSNPANSVTSALSVSRRDQTVQSMAHLQSLFSQASEDHLKKLSFLLQTLTFMSRKLHCLELIIQQYGKVLRARSEHALTERTQQSHLLLSIEAIERKYEAEMKKLAQFYQQQLKRQTAKPQPIRNSSPLSDEAAAVQELREENGRLAELLRQAKDLLSTKEEFIASLSEENLELREEVEKWRRPSQIRGSADSSLGYSVTAGRQAKKESSCEMGHIAERLNMALNEKGRREWDEFEEGSHGDIDYSELESVKDREDPIEDWDISHLEVRQNSNAKSLEEDCLKIMGNKKRRKDEEAF